MKYPHMSKHQLRNELRQLVLRATEREFDPRTIVGELHAALDVALVAVAEAQSDYACRRRHNERYRARDERREARHTRGGNFGWVRFSAIVATLVVVSGCMPEQVFVKPGMTEADWNRDLAQCTYEAAGSTQTLDYSYRTSVGRYFDQGMRRNKLIRLCLLARGYTLQSRVQLRADAARNAPKPDLGAWSDAADAKARALLGCPEDGPCEANPTQ